MENTYGFTIKDSKTKKDFLNEESYQKILREWEKRGEILYLIYEDKTKDGKPARLHCHGTIKFHGRPLLLGLLKQDYIIKFEQIYDLDGWHKYCSKNERKVVETIKENPNNVWMFD